MRALKLLFALALLGGCAKPRERVLTSVTGSRDGYSLFELGTTFRDQHGNAKTLRSLSGRPLVVAMIYTRCSASCPITLVELKRIAASTPRDIGIVLVSLDPSHDTPATLAMYASEKGLDDRWTLLSGTDAAVRELAVALGVRYQRASPDEIDHTNAITVLDVSGAIAHQQLGVSGTDQTIDAARSLASAVK